MNDLIWTGLHLFGHSKQNIYDGLLEHGWIQIPKQVSSVILYIYSYGVSICNNQDWMGYMNTGRVTNEWWCIFIHYGAFLRLWSPGISIKISLSDPVKKRSQRGRERTGILSLRILGTKFILAMTLLAGYFYY